jgi:hypothetical protein
MTSLAGLSPLFNWSNTNFIRVTALPVVSLSALPNLATFHGGLILTDNPNLTELDVFDAVPYYSASVLIENNPSLVSVSWPNQVNLTLNGNITVRNQQMLKSMTASFAKITGSIVITDNPALEIFSMFKPLTVLTGDFAVQRNANLTTMFKSAALANIGGSFIFGENAKLAAIPNFSSLTRVNGSVSVRNMPALGQSRLFRT